MLKFLKIKKVIALTLVILMAAMPLLAQDTQNQDTSADDFLKGKMDGQRDAKGNPAWIFGGALCGIFGFIGAVSRKPSPPMEIIIKKSSSYIIGYTEGYGSKARNQNTMYACGGWAGGVAILIATGVIDFSAEQQ